MNNPLKAFVSFISYWYFRYTLVTELYMVEPWERKTCNVLILLVFLVLSIFNYKVVLPICAYIFFPELLELKS